MSIENIYVLGNYNSGTNWIHYLIQKNLREDVKSQTLLHVHRFTDDNNKQQCQWKHVAPVDLMLKQQKLLVVYLIRPFEQWASSMIHRPYGSTLKPNGWIEKATRWCSEPGWLHDVYCNQVSHIHKLLCEQQKHYIIARTDKLQQSNGVDLLQCINNNTDLLKTTDNVLECWTSNNGPEKQHKDWKTKSSLNKPVYPVDYKLTHEIESLLNRLDSGHITSFD